jgi:HAD superfamily phosphoserine phosphatase-like hydrolase
MNGVPYEVAEMTRKAMAGEVPFEEVFSRRLDLIRPARKHLAAVGKLYVNALVDDAAMTARALQWLGVEVRIVSGGYREALAPLAESLGVPPCHVHANDLRFDGSGGYAGYDEANPLARSGGKGEVLRTLPREPRTMLVGDGASDAEVGCHAELFVGYGGVERREPVRNSAPVYLHGESLAPLAVMAGGREGTLRLLGNPTYRGLAVKGLSILLREGAADYRPEYAPFFRRLRKFCLEGM